MCQRHVSGDAYCYLIRATYASPSYAELSRLICCSTVLTALSVHDPVPVTALYSGGMAGTVELANGANVGILRSKEDFEWDNGLKLYVYVIDNTRTC